MMFNAKKFELLHFWAHHDEAPLFDYIPDKSQIAEKLCLQDLGVMINSNLTFESQIEGIIQSGAKMVGWALRTFGGRRKELMLTVLRSLIQPRLEYCCQLWSPREQLSINKIEKGSKTQRKRRFQ